MSPSRQPTAKAAPPSENISVWLVEDNRFGTAARALKNRLF